MEKINVFDVTKWFLENNLDTPRDTFKGNMKLQKLLFFAQLISLAKNNKLLFDDEFCAFENGMVMEKIRIAYKKDLLSLLNYDRRDISKDDLEVLELTKDIYGLESADTLSNMTHQFEYWKKYLNLSNDEFDFKNKNKSVVPNKELKNELDNIRDVIDAYNITKLDDFESTEDLDY